MVLFPPGHTRIMLPVLSRIGAKLPVTCWEHSAEWGDAVLSLSETVYYRQSHLEILKGNVLSPSEGWQTPAEHGTLYLGCSGVSR